MADQFSKWDRFYSHFKYTNDARKALRWTEYELWAEKRRARHLDLLARHQVVSSLQDTAGKA